MQATFDPTGSVILRNPHTGYRYVIGREDERYMRVAAAVARNILEVKDASGHEHDDKGLFSSGSGGKAKHGERATKAHAAYHDLMAKAKAARIDAFNEVKKDAESASNDADESAKKANEVLNDTPIWDDYDDGEEGLNFEDFESLLNNWDSSASANERFESLKEIERMAKQTAEITEFRDGDAVLADDKVAEIRKQMKQIIAYCRDARQHLKTFAKHRREMRAIKAGEVMEVQESLDADEDEIGVEWEKIAPKDVKESAGHDDDILPNPVPIDEELWRQCLEVAKVLASGHDAQLAEFTAKLVDADAVKREHEMDFLESGQPWRYDFIPKNPPQIWLDKRLSAHDIAYDAYHEAIEARRMEHGEAYDAAHKYANTGERQLRREMRAEKALG